MIKFRSYISCWFLALSFFIVMPSYSAQDGDLYEGDSTEKTEYIGSPQTIPCIPYRNSFDDNPPMWVGTALSVGGIVVLAVAIEMFASVPSDPGYYEGPGGDGAGIARSADILQAIGITAIGACMELGSIPFWAIGLSRANDRKDLCSSRPLKQIYLRVTFSY